MLNINELEQRWLKYKIKSYIPHAVIAISTIAIIIVASLFLNKEDSKSLQTSTPIKTSPKKPVRSTQEIEIKKIRTPKIKQSNKGVITQRKLQVKKVYSSPATDNSKKKMTIAPSLDFMKKMQGNTLSNYERNTETYTPPQNLQSRPKQTPKIENEPVKKAPVKVLKKSKIVVKKSEISIKRQNTHDDITQVIARFNKNNNPALSLFIAKKYYELGDYHKSYNYALITNEINSEIEASWIVFAKSLVKLNEKDLAIKTLKKYVSQSNSNRANILLDEILSGKFK